MERIDLLKVLEAAAAERGCSIVNLDFDEDDNVIDVTVDKAEGRVDLSDCEYIHRAVLKAFDRDVEDYALTVGSVGISGAEADLILKEMDKEQ